MNKIESLESQVAFLKSATERKQMQLTIAKQQAEIELLYEVQKHNEKEYFKLKKDLLNSRKAEPTIQGGGGNILILHF